MKFVASIFCIVVSASVLYCGELDNSSAGRFLDSSTVAVARVDLDTLDFGDALQLAQQFVGDSTRLSSVWEM